MVAIREATIEDVPMCATLRAVYITETVWQFAIDTDAAWGSGIARATATVQGFSMMTFTLQQTRLPRRRALVLPWTVVPLADVWESYALRLVVANETRLYAYLLIQLLPDQQRAMIDRLLVDVPMRRKGIGRALLHAARAWARFEGIHALTAHAPLRNAPGITFYQQCGFRISGLLEHFYPTREDGLLLSLPL